MSLKINAVRLVGAFSLLLITSCGYDGSISIESASVRSGLDASVILNIENVEIVDIDYDILREKLGLSGDYNGNYYRQGKWSASSLGVDPVSGFVFECPDGLEVELVVEEFKYSLPKGVKGIYSKSDIEACVVSMLREFVVVYEFQSNLQQKTDDKESKIRQVREANLASWDK